MNREQAKEAGEILIAYSEGKIIEYKDRYEDEWSSSSEDSLLSFNWNTHYYRIKPEQKLVPFTYEDRKKFMGKTVVSKHEKNDAIIICCNELHVYLFDYYPTYAELLEHYCFEDGSSCGKIIIE